MRGTSELGRRTTNTFFAKRFSELIDEWKSKTGKTQNQFAKDCFSNPNSIGKYKKGTAMPTDVTVNEMIRVFNEAGIDVTIEDFIPHTEEDIYHHDPNRVKGIQDHSREFAKNIGLSENFLDFITSCTNFSDPDEGYPIWSPLVRPTAYAVPFKTDKEELKYLEGLPFIAEFIRRPLGTTNAVTDDQKYTIPMGDGTFFLMSEIDLRILKDLQDKVVDVVEYFYFKRKKEMRKQEIEATKRAYDVRFDEENKSIFMTPYFLTKSDFIGIDPYMQYLKWVDKETGKEV